MIGGVEMQIKKLFILALSLMLILGAIAPAFAEDSKTVVVEKAVKTVVIENEEDDIETKKKEAKISKDKAIEIAKEALKSYFEYEIDEKKFESRIEFREDYGSVGEYAWSIDWHMYEENRSINIDVWINANDGKIKRISRHEYDHNDDGPTIAQITEEEAKIKAEDFIKRVNSKEYKEAKLEENKYPRYKGSTDYSFNYIRQINGIPFERNSISIQVDGIKGEVVRYSYSWDENIDPPSVEGIIDEEKAEEVMRDNVDMGLRYIPARNRYYYDEKVKEIKLVYNPEFKNGYIVDAKEGTMLDYWGKTLEEEKIKDITEERKEEIFKSAKIITKQNKEISEDRAREVVAKYIAELYGDGYEIDRLRYIENDDYWRTSGKKAWSADFTKAEGFKRYDDGEVTIDALTEELINAYRYEDFDDEIEEGYKPVITWEEGYDKAIEAIAKYFPDKIKDIDTEARYRKHTSYRNGKEIPELQYYFRFQRKVNGIYFSDDSISIEIGTKEGNIRELRCRWNDEAKFPETNGAISKEDAVEIFFEKNKPELAYTKINNSDDVDNPDWEIKLVYRLPFRYYSGNNIDGFTGKFLDFGGEEISDIDNKFKETIKDHEAEKELSILASQGIIDTEEFELDKELTKVEVIKMLVDAKGYRPYMVRGAEDLKFTNVAQEDEDYNYLRMAIQYGILENEESRFDGDEKITKEELAEMVVKLIGYDEIAELKDIFKVSYKDAKKISKDKIGYVAICQGLDIIKDTDGKFGPKDKAKMVDVAIAVYNALSNLRE